MLTIGLLLCKKSQQSYCGICITIRLDFVVIYETAIASVPELLIQIEAIILETQKKAVGL
ncbi:hypothetical protein [Glaesserella parasuis]|uniref:Uncharacterized protein n=1 Tax=Glaesserella parasuis TaxID=738 RepID=A0A859IDN3_GLAPU|nr:hypothetical protein [Glaesserella parasuis]MDG6239286.1 hypothetical protein [Glaesserella parasuis]MDP0207178.1 hypothetical protein [Glaesserella parasuis]MWQ05889.1 hypothetical protein [Glaesserella parasuis]MWQ80547.1 hypothetical protein [Glaesserella parasuis]QKY72079.1 hypothetical protein FLK62_01545 [Glaesserella parasuis]